MDNKNLDFENMTPEELHSFRQQFNPDEVESNETVEGAEQ